MSSRSTARGQPEQPAMERQSGADSGTCRSVIPSQGDHGAPAPALRLRRAAQGLRQLPTITSKCTALTDLDQAMTGGTPFRCGRSCSTAVSGCGCGPWVERVCVARRRASSTQPRPASRTPTLEHGTSLLTTNPHADIADLSFHDLLSLLLAREKTERKQRRYVCPKGHAGFHLEATIEDLNFRSLTRLYDSREHRSLIGFVESVAGIAAIGTNSLIAEPATTRPLGATSSLTPKPSTPFVWAARLPTDPLAVYPSGGHPSRVSNLRDGSALPTLPPADTCSDLQRTMGGKPWKRSYSLG